MTKPPMNRWTLLLTLLLASPALAQESESWVGQTVMPCRPSKEMKFTEAGPDGKDVEKDMKWGRYRVLKEQDGRLRIQASGQEGWVDKDHVVLLRDAPKFFSLLIGRDPTNIWAWSQRLGVVRHRRAGQGPQGLRGNRENGPG